MLFIKRFILTQSFASMKIRSVAVKGLFNEFDYELNLNPELTFIHSPNGCGKTVLMHMIYSLFRGDVEFLQEVPFDRLDIDFKEGVRVIVENRNGRPFIQVQKNELESVVTPEEVEKLLDINYLPPDRTTITKKDGHIVNALDYYAHELYETIRRTKDDSALRPQPKDGRKVMNDSEMEFWCKDLKAKLDFIKDAGFEPQIPQGMRFPPSRYDLLDNREAYEELAFSVSDYVDRNYQLAESVIVYTDIVNNIFLHKTISVSDSGKIIVTMRNGTTIPLSKLSSGETQVLILFYVILFHSRADGMVIIDEPEISLHVSWQQMLGDYFSDICRVRKVQMVVSTHSPQVIHDKWDLAQELVCRNA